MSDAAPSEGYIVVADIAGSTALYEQLGDDRARQLTRACLVALTRVVERHGGSVLSTVGDELISAFEAVAAASAAAIDMHAAAADGFDVGDRAPRSLALRVGVHAAHERGEVTNSASEAVAVARRLASLGKPEQTMISAAVRDRLPGPLRSATRYVDDEPWRGARPGYIAVYELIGELGDVTAHAAQTPLPETGGDSRYRVRLGTQAFTVDARKPILTIGRSRSNDLVVRNSLASREHCRLELRHGRLRLTDHSTNGTTVEEVGQPRRLVRHQTVTLGDRGRLWFGRPGAENADAVVAYEPG